MDPFAVPGSLGWQVAGQTFVCLVVGAWVAGRLERTPARAHAVAVLAFGAALVTPVVGGVVNALGGGVFVAPQPATVYRLPGDDRPSPAFGIPGGWVQAVWAAGSAGLVAGLGVSYLRGRGLVARSEPVDDPRLLAALDAARTALGMCARPRLRSSPAVPWPMIWMWGGEPTVIVPEDTAAVGAIDWESVFVHELAHSRRRDHLTGLFVDVIAAGLFWNPAVWWVRAGACRASEFACDDWVARVGKSRVEFAGALLALRRAAGARAAAVSALAVLGRRDTLKGRVARLLQGSAPPPQCGRLWVAAAVALAGAVSLGLAIAQASPQRADALAAPIRLATD